MLTEQRIKRHKQGFFCFGWNGTFKGWKPGKQPVVQRYHSGLPLSLPCTVPATRSRCRAVVLQSILLNYLAEQEVNQISLYVCVFSHFFSRPGMNRTRGARQHRNLPAQFVCVCVCMIKASLPHHVLIQPRPDRAT